MSENESKPQFTITEMTLDDLDDSTTMRLQSWLDTYVNDEHNVTREWIEKRNQVQMSRSVMAARKERFSKSEAPGWVARNQAGEIIGSTTPYCDTDGVQHVGSLYVNKNYHGKGVGSALMRKVIEWADPTKAIELGVVIYNQRAKAFYKKWGFEEVPGSETLFAYKIPEVKMIRKAGVK